MRRAGSALPGQGVGGGSGAGAHPAVEGEPVVDGDATDDEVVAPQAAGRVLPRRGAAPPLAPATRAGPKPAPPQPDADADATDEDVRAPASSRSAGKGSLKRPRAGPSPQDGEVEDEGAAWAGGGGSGALGRPPAPAGGGAGSAGAGAGGSALALVDDGDEATDSEEATPVHRISKDKTHMDSAAAVEAVGRAVDSARSSAGKLLRRAPKPGGFGSGKLVRMECINFMCHERMALEFVRGSS